MRKQFAFILVITFFMMVSCKSEKPKEGTDKTVNDSTTTKTENEGKKSNAKALEKGKFPFEFPVVDKLNASKGDNVFAVNMRLVLNDYNEGKAKIMTQYLTATMEEAGDKESKVMSGTPYNVPNSGIVVIPKGQTAKVGDIVAGKWAVNLTRGIVTNASNPKSPKVTFIGLEWDNPAKAEDKKTGIGQYEYTLKENEFMVISKDFDPGSCCAVKKNNSWQLMDVFNVQGDMVMGTVFLEFTAVKKSDCIAIPLKGNFKAGDQVFAPWMSTMYPGKVSKVDSKMGRITVKFDDKTKGEKVLSFGEIIKDLPKL